MTLSTLIGLTLALIVIAATPGPGVLMTVTRTLQSGFAAGFWVVAGIVIMDIIVLLITLSGLSLLAQTSQQAWLWIKVFGSGYLLWLAWQNWHLAPMRLQNLAPQSIKQDLFTGILVSLTNPVLFYIAFLPAFIDISSLTWWDALVLIALVSLTLTIVLLGYAFAAVKLQERIFARDERKQRWLNRISSAVLTGLALILISSIWQN